MESLVIVLGLVAMIPFVTATFVALAVAAMPVMVLVLSWEQAGEPERHAPERPVILPMPHPTAA